MPRSLEALSAYILVVLLARYPSGRCRGTASSGKGSRLRCLEADHDRSYESQFKDWDACIWFQRGLGVKKMVKSTGEVMDCIDPHPYRWHYLNGKQIRPWKYEPLREA